MTGGRVLVWLPATQTLSQKTTDLDIFISQFGLKDNRYTDEFCAIYFLEVPPVVDSLSTSTNSF